MAVSNVPLVAVLINDVVPLNLFPPVPKSLPVPVLVSVVVPLNVLTELAVPFKSIFAADSVTVPPNVDPPLNVMLPALPEIFGDIVVPLKVAAAVVLSTTEAAAPVLLILPEENVSAVVPEIVSVLPLRLIVPGYPLMEILPIVGAISSVQFPIPLPLNIAATPAPGTEAPPGPPDVADQFAVLFQLDVVVATQ